VVAILLTASGTRGGALSPVLGAQFLPGRRSVAAEGLGKGADLRGADLVSVVPFNVPCGKAGTARPCHLVGLDWI
jgi:hypothetical protein